MDKLGVSVKGRIPAEEQLAEGRALARLTDLGYGGPLRELFAAGAPDTEVPPALARACVDLLAAWGRGDAAAGPWSGVGRPAAVVSIPSATRPRLVDSLARGIAHVGRLPYLGELERTAAARPGQGGGNSAFRLAGVWEAFDLGPVLRDSLAGIAGQPVLLVDDLVDSRWSLTVAGRLLRRHGVGAVLPLALAQAG
jgi:ATP-dependent DNA helicase RecQ